MTAPSRGGCVRPNADAAFAAEVSTAPEAQHPHSREGSHHETESPSWVVMDATTQAFVCRRCGETYAPSLPCEVSVFAATCRAFSDLHARCREATP